MFEIVLTPEAIEDLRSFKKNEQRRLLAEAEKQLRQQPTLVTRNCKRLRPNKLAEWELRLDKFRVFYDVDEVEQKVKIVAVGIKHGSILLVHGEEYQL